MKTTMLKIGALVNLSFIYLTVLRILVLVALAGCGAELSVSPDLGDKQPVQSSKPEDPMVCSVSSAVFCQDLIGTYPNVANAALNGLYASFTVPTGANFSFARLVELGGHKGPGGGAAITMSINFLGTVTLQCAWWNASLGVSTLTSGNIGYGSHGAECMFKPGNIVELYLDGVLLASAGGVYTPTTGLIGVGKAPYASGFDYPGAITEAGVY